MTLVRIIFIAVAMLASGVASARDAKRPQTPLLPEKVAGFVHKGAPIYIAAAGSMKGAATYWNGAEWAHVYIYTGGRADIPLAYDEAISKGHYERLVSQQSKYIGSPLDTFALPVSKSAHFNCGRFFIAKSGGKADEEFLCVTNRDGLFIRVELYKPKGSLFGARERNFISSWL